MVSATFFIPKRPLKNFMVKVYHVSPDIVFGGVHALFGIAVISYVLVKYGFESEVYKKKYRLHNIVVRPDDPRAQQRKLVSGLDLKK